MLDFFVGHTRRYKFPAIMSVNVNAETALEQKDASRHQICNTVFIYNCLLRGIRLALHSFKAHMAKVNNMRGGIYWAPLVKYILI